MTYKEWRADYEQFAMFSNDVDAKAAWNAAVSACASIANEWVLACDHAGEIEEAIRARGTR